MKYRAIAAILLTTSGCARTPPITTTYFAAKTGMFVKLVQTIACDKQNRPVVAFTTTTAVTHTADHDSSMTINLDGLDGEFSNGELKLEFLPDGRLKGVNATSTGQGAEIVKAAVSLATTLAAKTAVPPMVTECKALRKLKGDDAVTITYEAYVSDFDDNMKQPIAPTILSQDYYNKFKQIAGDSCIVSKAAKSYQPVSNLEKGAANYVLLRAKQPAFLPLSVTTGRGGGCSQDLLWSGLVPVGQRGQLYDLPIPKAAAFGKQVFAVVFDESGAINKLEYGKDSGMASSLGATQSLIEFAKGSSAKDKAASINSDADLIVAQQRLVKCQASPESCE